MVSYQVQRLKLTSWISSDPNHHVCLLSHSVMSDSLHATPWTVFSPNSLSIEFSRQECWSGLPFPFSRGSSQPRDRAYISSFFFIGRQILYHCTTWEHKPRDRLTFTVPFHHHILYWIIVSKEMYIWSGECRHNWSIKHVPILNSNIESLLSQS